jgi:hypothetical protein
MGFGAWGFAAGGLAPTGAGFLSTFVDATVGFCTTFASAALAVAAIETAGFAVEAFAPGFAAAVFLLLVAGFTLVFLVVTFLVSAFEATGARGRLRSRVFDATAALAECLLLAFWGFAAIASSLHIHNAICGRPVPHRTLLPGP